MSRQPLTVTWCFRLGWRVSITDSWGCSWYFLTHFRAPFGVYPSHHWSPHISMKSPSNPWGNPHVPTTFLWCPHYRGSNIHVHIFQLELYLCGIFGPIRVVRRAADALWWKGWDTRHASRRPSKTCGPAERSTVGESHFSLNSKGLGDWHSHDGSMVLL